MNAKITLAYAIFTILLVPFGGTALLIVAGRLRKRHQPRLLAVSRLLLSLIAAAMLLTSATGLVAVIGWGLHATDGDNTLISSVVADTMIGLLLVVIGWSGFQSLRLSLKARVEMSPAASLDLEERLGLLQAVAWCLVGVPLLFVAPLATPVLLIPFVLIEGPASAKRSKQGHLLWLLAIAVRQQQPLPPLLDSYAESLRGERAFSITRFVRFLRTSRFQIRTRNLADRLRDGVPLPDALEDCPGLLTRSAMIAIRVGHESGCLGESLERVARRHARALQQVGTVTDISAFFIYGTFVLSGVICILSILMISVVPRFQSVFESFDVSLPTVTAGLISTADSVKSHLLLAAPIVSLPCVLLAVTGIAWFWGPENLRLPWLTRLWPRLHSSALFRCLSLALAGDKTLERALTVQIDATHHPEMTAPLERIRETVVAGGNGWAAMRQERLINGREEAVLECSQRLGNISWALQLMADSIDRRLHRRVLWCYQVARPVIIGTLGLLVALVCIGFFYPIVTLILKQS